MSYMNEYYSLPRFVIGHASHVFVKVCNMSYKTLPFRLVFLGGVQILYISIEKKNYPQSYSVSCVHLLNNVIT